MIIALYCQLLHKTKFKILGSVLQCFSWLCARSSAGTTLTDVVSWGQTALAVCPCVLMCVSCWQSSEGRGYSVMPRQAAGPPTHLLCISLSLLQKCKHSCYSICTLSLTPVSALCVSVCYIMWVVLHVNDLRCTKGFVLRGTCSVSVWK